MTEEELHRSMSKNYRNSIIAGFIENRQKFFPLNRSKWIPLRYKAFKKYGKKCACCESTTGPFHIDHIKPRSKYPELCYEINNLQVLCEDCNLGKSNTDYTDWR